ncbi:MAG: CRTAC1 family protein [Gemmobacter sp.]
MRSLVIWALLAAPALAEDGAADPLVPVFTEVSVAAGVTHSFAGEVEYMVGGGVAVTDCNGDGFEDMVIAGGSAPAATFVNRSVSGGPLVFERVTSGAELDAVLGVYPLDVDSDGVRDIVLLRWGENVVMRGRGDCTFTRANEDWGFDGGDAWSAAMAATWERGQTWPTIAIGNYIDRKEEAFPWGSCTPNWLHRPGTGGFAPPVDLTPSHCALSMLFTDWNRSGTPALRVSNDREYYKGGQEQMWRIDPGQPPALYGEAEGWKRLRIWGMGIASHDVTNDGYPDYFLTSMADNKLQVLKPQDGAPKADFVDVAFARGATAHRPHTGDDLRPSTAWHAQFDDVNNDGLADLYVVKGNVAKMPDFAAADPNNLLLQRGDGTFIEASVQAGVASTRTGRGGALADFNLDGRLDMVAVNRWDGVELWQNDGPAGASFALMLAQPGANRDAIGAWVEVRTGDAVQRREITVGGGHAGGQLGWRHFGLDTADRAEVRVIWPDGTEGAWYPVAAGTRIIVSPGAVPEDWVAAR